MVDDDTTGFVFLLHLGKKKESSYRVLTFIDFVSHPVESKEKHSPVVTVDDTSSFCSFQEQSGVECRFN